MGQESQVCSRACLPVPWGLEQVFFFPIKGWVKTCEFYARILVGGVGLGGGMNHLAQTSYGLVLKVLLKKKISVRIIIFQFICFIS